MVRDSAGGLMDNAMDMEVLGGTRRVFSADAAGALAVHDLRTRASGHVTFIEFHLVVPGRMAAEDAHDMCDRLERSLRDEVGGAVITIHVEPEGKAKQCGILVL